MKACWLNSNTASSTSTTSQNRSVRLWSCRILPVIGLWWLLCSTAAIEGSLEKDYAVIQRQLSSNDDDSLSYEEPDKYQPGKQDVRCEYYYNQNINDTNNQSSSENGGNRER
jgi:hypothetical protein